MMAMGLILDKFEIFIKIKIFVDFNGRVIKVIKII